MAASSERAGMRRAAPSMHRTSPGGSGTRGQPERSSAGFTLIELLIVVVIIGVLASIAVPRFEEARERAHFAAIVSDFRHLTQVQELHLQRTMSYGNLGDLDFTPTAGVQVTVTEATPLGWAATGTHLSLAADQGCSIFLGNAVAPALPNGQAHAAGEGNVDCAR